MVSFSGVGSGIDFGSITSQLVRLERLPINAIETRKTGANRQVSLLGDFASRLSKLSTAAEALSAPSKIRAAKASSANDNRVKISASGAAQLGTFDINVTSLARAQTNQSRTFATDAAGVLGAGSLDINVGSGTPVTIEFDAEDSLSTLATRINNAETGVRASVLFDGTSHRLLVSADETGTANAITFNESTDILGFNDSGAQLVTSSDAVFTLAGVPVTRSSNTLSDVVAGVTFELLSETPVGEPATQVKIERDPDGVVAKMQAFVAALNEVQSFVSGQLGSKSASATESLRGDGMLQGFQRRFGSLLGGAHGPDGASLGAYGIKLGSDGVLAVDETKLKTAMSSSPEGLPRLFAGTEADGLVASLTALTADYTRSGDGILAAKQTSLRSRITSFDNQIERIERSASSLEDRLRKQFTAADTTIALLNSQSSYISAMLYRATSS